MTRDEMILNNQGLIGYTIKKLNLIKMYDEIYDLGLIGLIKAVDNWDKHKGTFATYGYVCIRNEILYYMRKQKIQTISLETPITNNLNLEDLIKDDYDFEDDIIKNDLLMRIKNNLDTLKQKEKECIIRYYFKKQTMTNISNELNISQPQVTRLIQSAIKKLKLAVK